MEATLADQAEQIDRFVQTARDDARWRAEAMDHLRVFRASWVRHHVTCDAIGGLHADLTDTEPRVTPLVNRLRSESLRLIECCDFALAALRRPDSSLGEARHAMAEVGAQARRYRARMASATYETISVDLGCG
jgi:hypothetical protein